MVVASLVCDKTEGGGLIVAKCFQELMLFSQFPRINAVLIVSKNILTKVTKKCLDFKNHVINKQVKGQCNQTICHLDRNINIFMKIDKTKWI